MFVNLSIANNSAFKNQQVSRTFLMLENVVKESLKHVKNIFYIPPIRVIRNFNHKEEKIYQEILSEVLHSESRRHSKIDPDLAVIYF